MIIKIKGGPGSGHHGHAGRPGKRGGSLPGKGGGSGSDIEHSFIGHKRLVKNLKKFYTEESLGLPHDDAMMYEIAHELADIIEDVNNWTPVLGIFESDEEYDADLLRKNYANPIAIDQAVNGLHQALLDAIDRSGESSEEMLREGYSLREYLLTRL